MPTQEHVVPGGYTSPHIYESSPWPLYYPYLPADYASWTESMAHHRAVGNELPLHAPMPVGGPAQTYRLPDIRDDAPDAAHIPPFPAQEPDTDISEENPLDVYLEAPQMLFRTPSELLTDLNTRSEGGEAPVDADSTVKFSPTSASSSSGPSLGGRKKEAREKPESLQTAKSVFLRSLQQRRLHYYPIRKSTFCRNASR